MATSALGSPDDLAKLGVGIGALTAVVTAYQCLRPRPKVTGAPYVEGHWLLGTSLEQAQNARSYSTCEWMASLHEKLGKTIVYKTPGKPHIVGTTDPKNVEYVLKTNFDNFPKGDWFHARLADLLGDGIFNVDGHLWYSQRKTSSHMFTANQFKNHIWKVVDANCQKLVEVIAGDGKGQQVDLFNLLNRFTLDTIGAIGFARDIGSLTSADSPFLKSFDFAQQVSVWRFINPLWKLFRFFLLGMEQEGQHHFRLLQDYALETAKMLKDDPAGEKGDSFVGMFVAEAKKHGETLDDKFLTDMVLNFLIAGRDTTAQAMSWTFLLIMQHPEVERKILQEIDSEIGSGTITYDSTSRLKYLQHVIDEGLRLYPSVPADSKTCLCDDTLPDGTFLPKGTVVQYNIYAMGRSKEFWGEDAKAFRPERWENLSMPSSYAYPAFNAGPRECLGKRLAWVEMKACIAQLLHNFHFELAVPADQIKQDVQLTIGMSSGLPVKVTPRN